jgi:hypothetical protein
MTSTLVVAARALGSVGVRVPIADFFLFANMCGFSLLHLKEQNWQVAPVPEQPRIG